MIEYKQSETFLKGEDVKIVSRGQTYFGKVTKEQYHQWLYTNQGVFNVAHPDVKCYRKIVRYEDEGRCA